MAACKYTTYIQESDSDSFDQEHPPGSVTPFSAIYRCIGCGREIVSEGDKPFPPENHHQHPPDHGPARWKMVVWADHNPK